MNFEDVDKQVELLRNKKEIKIENVFKEIAQKQHKDKYELCVDILHILRNKGFFNIDYAKVVNEVNELLYNIENNDLKRLQDTPWYKEYKIEKNSNEIILIPIKVKHYDILKEDEVKI